MSAVKTAGLRTQKDSQHDWRCKVWLSWNETYLTRCSQPWWGRGRGPEHACLLGRPESPEPPEPPSAGAQRGAPCLQPPTPRSSSSPVAPQKFTSIHLMFWPAGGRVSLLSTIIMQLCRFWCSWGQWEEQTCLYRKERLVNVSSRNGTSLWQIKDD